MLGGVERACREPALTAGRRRRRRRWTSAARAPARCDIGPSGDRDATASAAARLPEAGCDRRRRNDGSDPHRHRRPGIAVWSLLAVAARGRGRGPGGGRCGSLATRPRPRRRRRHAGRSSRSTWWPTTPAADATGVAPGRRRHRRPLDARWRPTARCRPSRRPSPAPGSPLSPTDARRSPPPAPLPPGAAETVTVPGRARRPRGRRGPRTWPDRHHASSRWPPCPTLRLQQLLAQLGLPAPVASPRPTQPSVAPARGRPPRPGTFAWRWANHAGRAHRPCGPPGATNVITQGAVMSLRGPARPHHRRPGRARRCGQALLQAAGRRARRPLRALRLGRRAPEPDPRARRRSGATGRSPTRPRPTPGSPPRPPPRAPSRSTLRYTSTTMSGTNPDGIQVRRPGHPVGQLLQRRRRPARLRPRPATATPRASAASRCRRPTPRSSIPYTPLGTLVTVE